MWYLAVDGGGSSTRLRFEEAGSSCSGEERAGPSNLLVVGPERADAAMSEALAHAPVEPARVAGAVIGLAGADRPEVRAHWLRFFLARGFPRVWVVGDYRLAWAALAAGSPAIVAIVGTGSIVWGEGEGRQLRAGGYGSRLGDVASGLWLGTEAVRAALADWEGVGSKTALSELVSRRFGASGAEALVSRWYAPAFDPRGPAELAAAVLDLAETDAVARRLVGGGARGLVDLIQSVRARLPGAEGWPVGVSGGLAARWRPWLEREWWSRPGAGRLTVVGCEPVAGGVLLARRWVEEGRPSDAG